MPCSTASRTCLVRQKRHFPRNVLSQCEYAPVHLPFGDRYTDATNNRNIVVLPRLHGFVQKPTITDALLDCFQNMAFLCRGDTFHLPRSGGVSTSLLSPFPDRDSYGTNSQVPAVFSGSVTPSTKPRPRRQGCFQNMSIRKGDTFHVKCSGGELALLCFCLWKLEKILPPPTTATLLYYHGPVAPSTNHHQDPLLRLLVAKLHAESALALHRVSC
jgi:hypothetical protein